MVCTFTAWLIPSQNRINAGYVELFEVVLLIIPPELNRQNICQMCRFDPDPSKTNTCLIKIFGEIWYSRKKRKTHKKWNLNIGNSSPLRRGERKENKYFSFVKSDDATQLFFYKPHLGLLFRDFSNHFNLLPWSDPGPIPILVLMESFLQSIGCQMPLYY